MPEENGLLDAGAPPRSEAHDTLWRAILDYSRKLAPGQMTRVHIGSIDGGETVLYETPEILLEAPNWTMDGAELIVNGDGELWGIDARNPQLRHIPVVGAPGLNNDHVLAPDGHHIYLSANDWHIYVASLSGGAARRVTNEFTPQRLHFLHGVSPDGQTLAYIGLEAETEYKWGNANVYTLPSAGGVDTQLTFADRPADGCEFSPDGEYIYFNSAAFESTPGHSQIARMKRDGSELEQLTFDDSVNWFPHISPDGRYAVYLSYPPGTQGHPENLWVDVKLVSLDDWIRPTVVSRLFGGQGTINVNSWAPDSKHFAFVSYPMTEPVGD